MALKRVFLAGTLLLASAAFVPQPAGAGTFDENVDWLGGELQNLFRGGKLDIDAFYAKLRESFTPEQVNNVMDYLIPLLVKQSNPSGQIADQCQYLDDDLRETLFNADGTVNSSAFNDELKGGSAGEIISGGCDLALIEPGAGDGNGLDSVPTAEFILPPGSVCENGESCSDLEATGVSGLPGGPDIPQPEQGCQSGDVCGFSASATLTAVPGSPILNQYNVVLALTISPDDIGPTGTTADFQGDTFVPYYAADPNLPFDASQVVQFNRDFQDTSAHLPGQAEDLSVGIIAFGYNERQDGAFSIQTDVIAAAFGQAADPTFIANLSDVQLRYVGTGVGSIDVNALTGQATAAGALGDIRIDTGHVMVLNADGDGNLSGSYSILAGSSADPDNFGATGLSGNISTQVDVNLTSNNLAVTGNQFNAGNFDGQISVQNDILLSDTVTVTTAAGLDATVDGLLTQNGAVSSFAITVDDTIVSTGAAALGEITGGGIAD